MMIDQFHRKANYLRLAVTDRCNLRCKYCMPAEGIDFSHRNELLSYEEIIRLAHIFKDLGTNKVRLTGGEPFARKDFDILLTSLSEIYDELYITTNAVLIEPFIDTLKSLKIKGLNISLDTLIKEKFEFITRRDAFDKVMKNIGLCLEHAIKIKINCVVMNGINDDEIIDFIEFGKEKNIEIRFIEAMPFNESDGNYDQFLSIDNILERIAMKYKVLKSATTEGSSSISYSIDGQSFSIIPAYSRLLCASCNRIRLTPKGDFLTCLYANEGVSLRDILRNGASDIEIKTAIKNAFYHKKENGHKEQELRSDKVFKSMTTIGG